MRYITYCFLALFIFACQNEPKEEKPIEEAPVNQKIPVILDSDANNELDDQHAIAYMLFNGDVFDVKGITVNRTRSGGEVEKHREEAQRVVTLCGLKDKMPIYTGANGEFLAIRPTLSEANYDGAEAVDFIIETARNQTNGKLILLPIGKLTNIALALEKAPDIIPKVRVVWLGSNYPDPGEYNQVNDTASMTYVLNTAVDFEMVTVRYGKPSGTDAVRVTPDEVKEKMAGKGPRIDEAVVGRHGDEFHTFGDYAVNLFSHIDLHGDPPARALFDMAAVAVVKDPTWATATSVPAPKLINENWIDQPENPRKIIIWENFDRAAIMKDFYDRMDNYELAGN